MDIKTLQVRLPWTPKYSADFRSDPRTHKDFAHAINHVVKATGVLAGFIDNMDHDRDVALDSAGNREKYEKYLADLVICTLRACNTFPGGPIDLERAVIERIEAKNGIKLGAGVMMEPIGAISPRAAKDEIEGEAIAPTEHDKYDYCVSSWRENDKLGCTRPVHLEGDHVVGRDGLIVARWPQ